MHYSTAADQAAQVSYLPTLSKVAYSQVTELPPASPSRVISCCSDSFEFVER
ncbi:MAG: hypothetical protein ACI9OI_000804 [Chitinophagales bacterium]|jgi:hypothetical protein